MPRAVGSRLREHRSFVAFWTASTVSDLGSSITGLALQVLVLTRLGGRATDVGLVSAGRWLAYALVGLVAGLWLDRVRRRPVLIGTDLGQGIVLALVCGLALGRVLTVPVLVALMIVFGLCSLFNDAAYQSITPQLVPRPLLTRANTRLQQSTAVAQTGGPAVAGLLIKLVGAPLAIALDAISYVLSAAVLTRLPDEERKPTSIPTRAQLRAEIGEGLRWIYRHRYLGPLTLNTHAWFLCWAVLNTVMISYALTRLGFTALSLGVCLAVGGVTTLLGTSISERCADRWGLGMVILVARLGYPVGVVCLLLAPSPIAAGDPVRPAAIGWFLAAQLIIGAVFGLEGPAEITFRQAVTPDRLQGRTNSTGRSANRAMIVIGAPLGGLLADRAGYPVALSVAAIGFAVVAIAYALSPMRSARLPSEE